MAAFFTWKRVYFTTLIMVIIAMTLMSFSYGISGDEIDMNNYGKAILDYYTSFGKETNALGMPKSLDRDGVLQYYGGLFDLIAVLINKISPLNEYVTRHILNAWTGFLAIFFASRICLRFAGYRAAILVVLLMFFAPFFLGHAMNNPKDIPFATAYIVAVFCIMRFVDKLPDLKWKDYILPILSISVAIDIRVAGLLLIPFAFLYCFLKYRFALLKMPYLKQVTLPVMLVATSAYLGACILWPYALTNPVKHPLHALSFLSAFKVSVDQVYNGRLIPSPDLPASYLIQNFMITNTYILLIGVMLFFVLCLLQSKKDQFAGLTLIVLITFFPLLYIMYKHANVYHAWRHVLFIFPGAAILSALGLEYLLRTMKNRVWQGLVLVLIGIGFYEPARFIITTFPNTVTYYNGMVGGTRGAAYDYEMDSYYNSLKQSCDWFIENELPKFASYDTVIVATNAAHIASVYFEAYPTVKIKYVRFHERSQSDWDYGIFHRALIRPHMLRNDRWMVKQKLYVASVFDRPLSAVFKRVSYKDFEGFELLDNKQYEQAYQCFKMYQREDPGNDQVNKVLIEEFLPGGQYKGTQ